MWNRRGQAMVFRTMVLIDVIVSPPNAPQTPIAQPVSPAPLRLDRVDEQILETLTLAGRYGLSVWTLLDRVADARNPSSRAERRSLRLDAWHRLKRLVHGGHVHWFGRKSVSKWKLPRMNVRRRRRSKPGSTSETMSAIDDENPCNKFASNLFDNNQRSRWLEWAESETKNARAISTETQPEPANLREARKAKVRSAAQYLARLPRGVKRKLSGYIGATRIWRGRPILLLNGEACYAYGAVRGKVIWSRHEQGLHGGFGGEPFDWGVIPASEVRLWKNPHAVTLGRAKAGSREKPSLAKRIACRRNGCQPCRPGRRRGRPRRQ